MRHAVWLCALCLLLLLTSAASADQVLLENGDRVTGTIVKMVGGVLEIDTAYAGIIKVKWEEVSRVQTEASAKVRLETGEVVSGALIESAAGTLMALSPAVGETISIPLDQVSSINEPPTPPATWRGYAEIASTYRTGNVDSVNARLRASLVRETKQDRISADVSWKYEEQEDNLTARNASAQVKYDYFAWDTAYIYAATGLESDEFKDLKLRTKIGLGVGRRFIVEPRRTLEGEAGLTYVNDDFEQASDEDSLTVRLFGKYSHQLVRNVNFMQSLEVLPAVDDLSDVRLTSVTELSSRLSTHWSVVWSLIDDYDSEPSPGFEENDLTHLISLRYTF